jgi:CubicO group peptidase (beta-lactamase class C family)
LEISGFCEDKFAPVKSAFEANFKTRGEIGASVAVSLNGEMVVDLWGGQHAAEDDTPWEKDTIVNVWSSTKTMAAMSVLLLADRGEIALEDKAARYWPEFASEGKEDVTIAHFLSHQAGLSGMDVEASGEAFYDWEWMISKLAAQRPWWEPGTKSGYHALTQGYLLGEIVRRVTGQTPGAFFKSEIAEPLGADFQIGVRDESMARICPLTPPPARPDVPDDGSIASRTFASPAVDAAQANETGWQKAEIPAANGHGNARSIVRAQTPMANGGFGFGKQIISESMTRRVFEEQARGPDLVLGIPLSLGLGYGLNSELVPLSPNKNTCYWGGYGGSIVLVDQDARVCFSYVMNRMEAGLTGDERGLSLVMALYQSLMQP